MTFAIYHVVAPYEAFDASWKLEDPAPLSKEEQRASWLDSPDADAIFDSRSGSTTVHLSRTRLFCSAAALRLISKASCFSRGERGCVISSRSSSPDEIRTLRLPGLTFDSRPRKAKNVCAWPLGAGPFGQREKTHWKKDMGPFDANHTKKCGVWF